jgi:hypothetical protein
MANSRAATTGTVPIFAPVRTSRSRLPGGTCDLFSLTQNSVQAQCGAHSNSESPDTETGRLPHVWDGRRPFDFDMETAAPARTATRTSAIRRFATLLSDSMCVPCCCRGKDDGKSLHQKYRLPPRGESWSLRLICVAVACPPTPPERAMPVRPPRSLLGPSCHIDHILASQPTPLVSSSRCNARFRFFLLRYNENCDIKK